MFGDTAARLAALTAALLGWRPEEFWRATPAELAGILALIVPTTEHGDSALITRLKEQFPDG